MASPTAPVAFDASEPVTFSFPVSAVVIVSTSWPPVTPIGPREAVQPMSAFCSIWDTGLSALPEKLRGVLLSAMCAPDLRGTQGMFSYYTTRPGREGERIGGEVHRVARNGDTIRADLIGPDNPFLAERGVLKTPFVVTLKGDQTVLNIDGNRHELRADLARQFGELFDHAHAVAADSHDFIDELT